MPRNVRNFWVDVDVDGYQNTIGAGPRNKYDGLTINLYQRDEGSVGDALTIKCYRKAIIQDDGKETVKLVTSVRDSNGNVVYEHETFRNEQEETV